MGDFNAVLGRRRPGEHDRLGPHACLPTGDFVYPPRRRAESGVAPELLFGGGGQGCQLLCPTAHGPCLLYTSDAADDM
eukprot:12245873-Alexandrium_andersonii.AAC.1